MAKGRSESPEERDAANGTAARKDHSRSASKRKSHKCSESDSDDRSSRSDVEAKHGGRSKRKRSRSSKARSRRKYSDEDDSSSSARSSDYSSDESEEERRRRKRRERKRREEKERKKRRRDKEEKRGKKDGEDKKKKKKDKKKDSDKGKKGAVTNSWGKYGIIRESDMWNKRPEFTAWLLEVKKVNIESLPNWEEKQMFKDFMEDHNTGTFPSKKYYNLDAYFQRKMEKELINGMKDGGHTERTIFNDEEQRRLEMQKVRERQKEEEVEALKRSMQSGMAQAMKEQARLKEEMAYQYKLGNFEAAAAIQRRLDPDVPM